VRANDKNFALRNERRGIAEFVPYVFGGTMLVAAFAFAGHYMGQNASAHNLTQDDQWADVVSPSTTIFSKGSLLPTDTSFEIVNLRSFEKQEVASLGKADFIEKVPAVVEPKSIATKSVELKSVEPKFVAPKSEARLVTGSVTPAEPVKKIPAMTPPVPKPEKTLKLKSPEKQKVIAQRRVRVAEENCLARAVYFEARSESELGQLAVAKVILNRTRDQNYPKTICGVVYQGSDKRNSCQFSFACDGLPDDVRSAEAWARSKRIAQKALAGDRSVVVLGAATNYHADYVRPAWSRNMKRLIKIGRHIFYSDT
jgi:spore germination cell wall hydrolase CwlJ-like protein